MTLSLTAVNVTFSRSWISLLPRAWSKFALRPLDRFLSLHPAQQRRYIHALLVVIAIRLGLWTIRFQTVRHIVENVSATRRQIPHPSEDIDAMISNISRTVRLTARIVPEATCLTRALAAQVLLAYEGLFSTLRIGVARGEKGEGFKAHAWLECDGRIVIGGDEMPEYFPLPPIQND
jgi:hypothetical protein